MVGAAWTALLLRGLLALLGLGVLYVLAWAQFAEDRDMTRLQPVWTRGHLAVVALVGLAVGGATAGALLEPPAVAAAIAALIVVTVAAGLGLDPFIGIAVGCAGAAGAVAVKQALGVWGEEEFAATLVHVVVLFSLAPLAGLAGRVLGGGSAAGSAPPGPEGTAAYGSLGLLPAHLGAMRLEEEVDRARQYGRPLSLVRVTTRIRGGQEVTDEEEEAVLRAVARLVEGHVQATDVPFAYEAGDIVVILPEANERAAWGAMSGLLDALTRASFVSPATNERHDLSDFAATDVSVASFPAQGAGAEELLMAVRPPAPAPPAAVPTAPWPHG